MNEKTLRNILIIIFIIFVIMIIYFIVTKTKCSKSKNYSASDSACPICPKPTACPTIACPKPTACPTRVCTPCPSKVPETAKHCDKHLAPIGENNNILKKFFEDENVQFNYGYLDDITSVLPGLVVADYDIKNKSVRKILPYNIYQKIVREKLVNKMNPNISIFVADIPIGQSTLTKDFQIYHSCLFFVESSKVNNNKDLLPEDILFSLELWGRGGELAASIPSSLYPRIINGEVDLSHQTLNKVVIEYPEAFGCSSDGGFWKGSWQHPTFLGDTSLTNIDKLYDISIAWLSKNYMYTYFSLVSEPCSNDKVVPSSFIMGTTCQSYGQGMCLELEKLDPGNFSNLLEKISWNDPELIGSWEKINLQDPKQIQLLNTYLTSIDENIQVINKLLNLFKHKKENFEFNFSSDDKKPEENNFYSKYILNLFIASIVIPLIIKFAVDKSIYLNQPPYVYVVGFVEGSANVYKVTLKSPYLQSIYSLCPGLMYRKSHMNM